jgi:hypothetical protein
VAVTDEQKEQLLALIRAGYDRGAAAQEVGGTGTQFRRLCNPESPNYDADFATAYAAACEERGPVKRENSRPAATPRTTTEQGFTRAKYISKEDWVEFLDRVRAGVPRDKAARDVGTSLSQMHTYASRSAGRTVELDEAYTIGLPHFKEALRARAYELAMEGNYSALRDLAVVHLDEYAVLQTKRHEIGGIGGGALKVWVDQVFPNLPPEMLDGLIRELEQQQPQEQKQLPPPRLIPATEEVA